MANNETAKLQEVFDTVWMDNGSPKGFALFHDKHSIMSTIIYVSPIACDLCRPLLTAYRASPCEAPPSKDIGLLLGRWDNSILPI
jgi:hypothetical protein